MKIGNYSILRGVYAGWYQQICSLLGAFLVIPFIMKYLGESAAGLWFVLQGWHGLLMLVDFGVSNVIARECAYTIKRDDLSPVKVGFLSVKTGWDGISQLINMSERLVKRSSIIAFVFAVIAYDTIFKVSGISPHLNINLRISWYLMALSVPFVLIIKRDLAVLEGVGFIHISRLIVGTQQLILALFTIMILQVSGGIEGLASSFIASILIQYFAVKMFMKFRLIELTRIKYIGNEDKSSTLWALSKPFGVMYTGGYMVGAAQIPLIGLVFGPDYIPSIYIIFKLSQALNTAFGMYSSANYPIFTRLVAEDNWVDARSVVKKTLKLGLIIHVISGIGIILASNQLALTFFHIEFNINKVMVVLLAINHIVTSVASLPAGFVVAFGRNPFALSTLAHGALFFLMIIILSNWIGVLALPIAGLLSVLLTNAWFNFLHMHRMWADINYNIVK